MNRAYALVWNHCTGAWSVTDEHARRSAKGSGAVLAAALLLPGVAHCADLPSGGDVVFGQGQISTPANNQMVIDQASSKLTIDWQTFDIGTGHKVTFNQPGSDSVALNRVLGSDGSKIMGTLEANGQVFLVNPNGVLFGRDASVNVGGLVASTLDISNDDFESGNYYFEAPPTNASVINQGNITAADGGAVALLGGHVSNEGVIVAKLGTVALAAGDQITLDFAGDGLLNLYVDDGVKDALVENHQLIQAEGGTVILNAHAANTVLKTVVNNTGVIEARTLGQKNGKIALLDSGYSNDIVQVAGTLDASAPDSGDGGHIAVQGRQVSIAADTRVTTQANAGDTGTLAIQGAAIVVGNESTGISASALSSSLEQTHVSLHSQADLQVNAEVSWDSDHALALTSNRNIDINAAITANGDAAGLTLRDGSVASMNGADHNVRAPISLKGENATLRINNQDYTLIRELEQLQNIGTGHYALVQSLDASHTTYDAALAGTLDGTFTGLGNTISNLTIDAADTNYVGLFGQAFYGSTIRDIGLIGGSVTGKSWVGGLVGMSTSAQLKNVYNTGTVTAMNDYAGGLVGHNTGTIYKAYATGTVSAIGNYAGGLIGANYGSLVSNAYASGNVNAGGNYAGGLIGTNHGRVDKTYASGAATALGADIGGLTGRNETGYITDSFYASTDATGNPINQTLGDTWTGAASTWLELATPSTFSNWDSSIWAFGLGAQVEGYGLGLPFLIGLTRQQDIVSSGQTLFSSGFGTQASAYSITSWQQLANINQVLGGGYYFNLNNDLDKDSAGYTDLVGSAAHDDQGWNPIGNSGRAFSGTFDGQGHTIGDLYVDGYSYAGLFGRTSATSHISNLTLANISVSGYSDVGGLIGQNLGGSISNVHVSGLVTGDDRVGGLVGDNSGGAISTSSFEGEVVGGGYVGGLVGRSQKGGISNSFTDARVEGNHYVGGLLGYNTGEHRQVTDTNTGVSERSSSGHIIDSHASGDVIASGNYIGGLVGYNSSGNITGAYAEGRVEGARYVGGLVGNNQGDQYQETYTGVIENVSQGQITDSHASGDVSASADNVGGLVGYNSGGNITGAYATGDISGQGSVGGLVGNNWGQIAGEVSTDSTFTMDSGHIRNSYATGAVTVMSGDLFNGQAAAGALVGYNNGNISDAYATGAVVVASLQPMFAAGGLVGINAGERYEDEATGEYYRSGQIHSSYASGTVSGPVSGGLVGINNGLISSSYATGDIASDSAVAGGLVGMNMPLDITNSSQGAYIENSYATGSVRGTDVAGGLVGANMGTVVHSYASGSAEGELSGGLVGVNEQAGIWLTDWNLKTLTDQQVLVPTEEMLNEIRNQMLERLGHLNGSLEENLWNSESSGLANGVGRGNSTGATGKSTAQLQTLSTFVDAGWDIDQQGGTDNAWRFYANSGEAPLLRSFLRAVTVSLDDLSKAYDGSSSASGLDYSTDLDSIELGGSLGYVTASANAGTYSTHDGSLSLEGLYSGQQGHDISYADTSFTIDRKALTVTGTTAGSKTYDGNTTASVNAGTLSGFVGNETVTVTAEGTFDDQNAGQRSVTADYTLVDGSNGGLASNYTLDSTTHSAAIDQKALTITGTTADSKTYDGNTSASVNAGTLSGFIGNETVIATAEGTFDNQNAGQRSVTADYTLTNGNNGGLASNYTLDSSTHGATIDKKALTITGTTADSKTYDGTTTTNVNAGTLSGFVGNETVTVTAEGTFDDQNAGQRSVTADYTLTNGSNGGLASNYTLDSTTHSATIDQKALTVTGTTASDKTYDGNTRASVNTGTLSGFVGNETVTATAEGTFDDQNAGQRSVTADYTLTNGSNGGLASNYTLASTTHGAAIDQKALTVTGTTASSKTYDGNTTASVNTGTLSGFVGNETVTATAEGTFDSQNAGQRSVTADYTLTNGSNGGLASNYTLASTTHSAAIDKKALTITGTTASGKTYDGNTSASVNAGTLSGFVGNETVTATAEGTFDNQNAGQRSVTADYTLANGENGGRASNYTLEATLHTATIDRKALSITASDFSKAFGQVISLGDYRADGLVSGEQLSSVSLSSTGTAGDAAIGDYLITASNALGTDLDNYDITYNNGTLTVIAAMDDTRGSQPYTGALTSATQTQASEVSRERPRTQQTMASSTAIDHDLPLHIEHGGIRLPEGI